MIAFEKKRFANMQAEFINKHRSYLVRQQKKLEWAEERKKEEEEEKKRKLDNVKFTFGNEIRQCDALIEQLKDMKPKTDVKKENVPQTEELPVEEGLMVVKSKKERYAQEQKGVQPGKKRKNKRKRKR